MLFRGWIAFVFLLTATLEAATLTVAGDASCQGQLVEQQASAAGALRYSLSVSAPYQINSMAGVSCQATGDLQFFTLPAVTSGETYLEITRFVDFSAGAPSYRVERVAYTPGDMFSLLVYATYNQSMWYTSGSSAWVEVRALNNDKVLPLFEGELLLAPSQTTESPVPEPSTLCLGGLGLLAAALRSRYS